jgi:hypothetical protein
MRLALFGVVLMNILAGVSASAAERDKRPRDLFSTQVRPILARHCYKCHGPDEKARKAKLRLDLATDALKPAASGSSAIVPGKPDESELISRIFSTDETELMPPPSAKLPLSPGDKQALKQWIAEGAEFKTHWSFRPPGDEPPPTVGHAGWPRNPIDSFVLARLEAEGLEPSEAADRPTWLRRVSLDLIGLPPTPAEIEGFSKDSSADAFEKQVDRMLVSPHYGERWARRWIDLARYADTNGYEKDRPRSIWPYRDWVIEALNADLPFDEFTIEQLAGDLLPGASPRQRVATGFHRNTMLNEEGGIDPLEFRFYATVDRVNTTGTVWLGLTLGCTQCHAHKYDPIPHRDYYQFMALLNNADEPEMPVPAPEVARRRRELEDQIKRLTSDLPKRFPGGAFDSRFTEWIKTEKAYTGQWRALEPVEATSNSPKLRIQADRSVFVTGDQSKRDLYKLRFASDRRKVTAIRLEVLPDTRLPAGGPGRVFYEGPFGDFFLSELTVKGRGGKTVKLVDPTVGDNPKSTVATAIDGDPQTGWSLGGGYGQAHSAVFQLAEPLEIDNDLVVEMLFERYHAAGLGRFRFWVTDDPRPVVARAIPTEIEGLLRKPASSLDQTDTKKLREYFASVAPELAAARKEIERLKNELPKDPTTLVLAERPDDDPRPTFIHNRGEYMQPTERVEPAVLSVLPSLPKGAKRDRLALARWLVAPENPLTARVTVNRHWSAFFGRGLVRTLEDFGLQGETPSHPELLDWLARELIRRGWSIKELHRLIALSATYRQSSRITPALEARDPENRLLARGPRVRLEAELIRDSAVRVSGLLCDRVGGPSVFPPQPAGVTSEGTYGGLNWKVSPGGDRFRRGLYTYTKRTAPFAMALTFDAPSGEVCVARRELSNTPLQALTLLNDPVFQEAAQELGRSMASERGTALERVTTLFQRCLGRRPDLDEAQQLAHFFAEQKRRFESKELDPARIAGAGNGDPAERAAWTVLARVLLNLDEFVTKG